MSMANVSTPQELQHYAEQLIASGRYNSASEMVRDVELGWTDMDSGRIEDFDPEAIKTAGRRRLARRNSI